MDTGVKHRYDKVWGVGGVMIKTRHCGESRNLCLRLSGGLVGAKGWWVSLEQSAARAALLWRRFPMRIS